jgi:hypothetical protein
MARRLGTLTQWPREWMGSLEVWPFYLFFMCLRFFFFPLFVSGSEMKDAMLF